MKWICVAHEKEIPTLAQFSRNGWQTYAVGIGQFHALLHFTELVAKSKPDAVILAGTCGTPDKADVMRTYLCHHFAFPFVTNEEVPELLDQNFSTQPACSIAGFTPATVLQNYGVSLDAEKFRANAGKIPAEFPRPALENMEAASLALACRRFGIPFSALLCATNQIGPTARTEWKQNFRAAGEKLAHAIASMTQLA